MAKVLRASFLSRMALPTVPPRADRRFRGAMLPWWSARALAVLLAAGAAGLPWLATWQKVLGVGGVAAEVAADAGAPTRRCSSGSS